MPGRFDAAQRPIKSDRWINDGLHSWRRETLQYDKCTLTAYPNRETIEQFNCSINGIPFTMPASSVFKAKATFHVYADAAMKSREASDVIGHGFIGNKVKVSATIKVEMADCTLQDISRERPTDRILGILSETEREELGVY